MTREAKTPAAVGAASGGDRNVLAGAERTNHTHKHPVVIQTENALRDSLALTCEDKAELDT